MHESIKKLRAVPGVELRLILKKRQKGLTAELMIVHEDRSLWPELSSKERQRLIDEAVLTKDDLEILRDLGLYVSDEEMEKAP